MIQAKKSDFQSINIIFFELIINNVLHKKFRFSKIKFLTLYFINKPVNKFVK